MPMSCTGQYVETMGLTNVELLDMLREKVACETARLLHLLYRGYRPDIQFILSEIQLIDMLSQGRVDDNLGIYAMQFYLNNSWEQSSNLRS